MPLSNNPRLRNVTCKFILQESVLKILLFLRNLWNKKKFNYIRKLRLTLISIWRATLSI